MSHGGAKESSWLPVAPWGPGPATCQGGGCRELHAVSPAFWPVLSKRLFKPADPPPNPRGCYRLRRCCRLSAGDVMILAGTRNPSPTTESGMSVRKSLTKPKTGQLQLILKNQRHTQRARPPCAVRAKLGKWLGSPGSPWASQAGILVRVGPWVAGPQPNTVSLLCPVSSLQTLAGRSCPPRGSCVFLPFTRLIVFRACPRSRSRRSHYCGIPRSNLARRDQAPPLHLEPEEV